MINAWIFIPAILYFRIAGMYSVNIPWSDDYDAILDFLYTFKNASFGDKLGLLFLQHNEHRIFSSRVIYIAYNAVFGHINFKWLTFIGNTQLLVAFFVSIYFIRRCIPKYWSIVAFIWGLCLFDLNSYENGGVAMTAVANNGIVMLFLVSLFFYSQDKKGYLVPAVIFQIISLFSNGNGVIASAFIVVYALLTRDRVKILFSTATLLIFTPLYFIHYTSPSHDTVPATLHNEVFFFLKMLGAHFSFGYALWFSLLIIVIILFTFPLKEKVTAPLFPFISILGFITATMAVTAIFRSNVKGAVFYASKYLIYPGLLAAIAFFFLFRKIRPTRWFWPVTMALIIGMLYSYREDYLQGRANFAAENNKLTTRNYYYPDTVRAKNIAEKACKAGIYCRQ